MTDQARDIYDPAFVKDVFDRCSDKYIAFSTVCSLGFTERWRRQCAQALELTNEHRQGYDLMAGTGELWPHLLQIHPHLERITAIDISSGMHTRALRRAKDLDTNRIAFIENDVLASGLPDESADFVVSTFGLKTFNPAQHHALAQLTARVLKPGGRFSYIEASDPKGWWLRPLYLFHLRKVLPMVERLFLRGAQDFAMIGTYAANFGDASGFVAELRKAGLEARFRKVFFGCATIAVGRKPDA